ncbi:hypothetical protein QQP08_001585 [Theobroma cacao]|nr:hypothetical protein QQP08_001585 [Theobroma cacao]
MEKTRVASEHWRMVWKGVALFKVEWASSHDLVIESDSNNAVKWTQDPEKSPWKLRGYLAGIGGLKTFVLSCHSVFKAILKIGGWNYWLVSGHQVTTHLTLATSKTAKSLINLFGDRLRWLEHEGGCSFLEKEGTANGLLCASGV